MKYLKRNLLWLAMAVSLILCACSEIGMAGGAAGYGSTAVSENSYETENNNIPAYSGKPYVEVHGNVPFFSEEELKAEAFESYSDLDALGRCGVAYSMVGMETMPTEKRGNISQVKPTGWHSTKYDNVDGKNLYNRCHLIGYQLTAENANKKNLITGTRYLNVQGMLPFENMTADYIKETGNHVLYRVTPVFEGDNLVASGVLMEGESAEDQGASVQFCVYVYNVQPGIVIDYATGDSWLEGSNDAKLQSRDLESKNENPSSSGATGSNETYVLNTNTKTFHKTTCSAVGKIKTENQETFTGSRADVIADGYTPCKTCNP